MQKEISSSFNTHSQVFVFLEQKILWNYISVEIGTNGRTHFLTIFNKLLKRLISKNSCKFLKIKILSILK